MTLESIYEKFAPGSSGFAQAVEMHCGFSDTSRNVLAAIGEIAPNAGEFERIWESPSSDEMAEVKRRAIEHDGGPVIWGDVEI